MEIKQPDRSCYPFARRGLYLAIVIPYLAVLVAVLLFLLLGKTRDGGARRLRLFPAMIFVALYVGLCHFQSYCCACLECPYVGEFCPAIAGIYPANVIAGARYRESGVVRSERKLEEQAALAGACWGAMMLFPLPWLARKRRSYALGYLAAHAVYYMFHGLAICPACSIRESCPGGKLQTVVLGRGHDRAVSPDDPGLVT
jgi:hypothetical protein